MLKRIPWRQKLFPMKNSHVQEEDLSIGGPTANARIGREGVGSADRLKDLSKRMEGLLGEMLVAIRGMQGDSARMVELEKEGLLEEARKQARVIIFEAEETTRRNAQAIENKVRELEARASAAETAARASKKEAERVVSEANESARKIEQSARLEASAAQPEAQDHPLVDISDTGEEQGETIIERDLEKRWEREHMPVRNGTNGQEPLVASNSGMSLHNVPREMTRDAPPPVEEDISYEGIVRVLLPRDTNHMTLLDIREALETTNGISIIGQTESKRETQIAIFVKPYVPLVEILGDLPEVSEVVDVSQQKGPLKRILDILPKPLSQESPPIRKLRLTIPFWLRSLV